MHAWTKQFVKLRWLLWKEWPSFKGVSFMSFLLSAIHSIKEGKNSQLEAKLLIWGARRLGTETSSQLSWEKLKYRSVVSNTLLTGCSAFFFRPFACYTVMFKVKILQFSFWFSGITEIKNASDHSDTDPDHRRVKHSFSFILFLSHTDVLLISSISKCPDKFHCKFNRSHLCHCHDCNKHDKHNQHRYCEQHCNNI